MKRLLGKYGTGEGGILLLVLAGIHGNERAGIQALKELFDYLEENDVLFKGRIVGLVGNLQALENRTRFIHKDLNRQWYASKIKKLHLLPFGMLNTSEDVEQKELFNLIEDGLSDKDNYDQVLMVDLHTTSARGGCFSITNDHSLSNEYAMMMPVPVISGMTKILFGTTLEYFESLGIPGIAFEAGQHVEEASVSRIKAAIMSIAYKNGVVSKDVYMDFKKPIEELRAYNSGLPYLVRVVYHHAINDQDEFVMRPGYSNFQEIQKGTVLADDINGEIHAPCDGLMLMPLYQKKGSDGFFIVEKLNV